MSGPSLGLSMTLALGLCLTQGMGLPLGLGLGLGAWEPGTLTHPQPLFPPKPESSRHYT